MSIRIEASSRALTADDEAKREIALDVLRQSSEPVLNFAKLMVPTSLSSIGVLLAITKDAIGPSVASHVFILIACALALVATVVFALAVYAQRVRVSLEDFGDIVDELLTLSSRRQRLVTVGMVFFVASVSIAIVGVLSR